MPSRYYLIFISLLIHSCVSLDVYVEVPSSNKGYEVYGAHHSLDTTSKMWSREDLFIQNMRKRAYQMAKIKWTPLDSIPQRNNGFFLPNITYTGMIYSSVKEMNKYVGQDVSFHTFLSAVSNPRSVLYTEQVDSPPYLGRNCAAYYGTVCSTAVDFALGLERPFPANYYKELPYFKRVVQQDFHFCSPGDVVWKDGHVVLITDVQRNEQNSIEQIEILESIGAVTSIKTYSLEQFEQRWKGQNWILYRFSDFDRKLSYDYIPYVYAGDNEEIASFPYNNFLCCSRGDRASYREGEDVVINILASDYSIIELTNLTSGKTIKRDCEGIPDVVFCGLEPGEYSACLLKNASRSEVCLFEVLETNVYVEWSGRTLITEFSSSNAEPDFIVFCSDYGAYYYFSDITMEEKALGEKKIFCRSSVSGLYIKVHFKGKYGRVSNTIIPLYE